MPCGSTATPWLSFSILAAQAHGAALWLREFGSPLNGTAGAGWAAVGEFVSNAVHFFNLNARWRL